MRKLTWAIAAAAVLSASTSVAAEPPHMVVGAKAQQMLYARMPAKDVDRTVQFYKLLGLQEIKAPGGHSAGTPTFPRYQSLSFNGTFEDTWLMISQRGEAALTPSGLLVAFKVQDVRAVVESVRAGGFTVVREPGPEPFEPTSTFAVLRDPDGNGVEVLQRQ